MAKKERTEEQKVLKAPIKITLGTTEYQLPILGFEAAARWRELLATEYGAIIKNLQSQGVDAQSLTDGMYGYLVMVPAKTYLLVRAYAPTVVPDASDDITDEQVAVAFSTIMDAAFPFFTQLATVTELFRQAERA